MRGVIAIALLAAVVVFAELPHTTKFMHELHKAGHPVVFGAIALLLLSLLTSPASGKHDYRWRPYISAFGITIAIGAATEIAQQFTHRDSSIIDVMSDATGAAASLALHAAWFGATSVAREGKVRIACWTLGLLATHTHYMVLGCVCVARCSISGHRTIPFSARQVLHFGRSGQYVHRISAC